MSLNFLAFFGVPSFFNDLSRDTTFCGDFPFERVFDFAILLWNETKNQMKSITFDETDKFNKLIEIHIATR